ncbi:hypothetical protein PVAND_012347 [Polypedilum vanderplanki]|uniref:Annexin n=1 Tax=Polypedilum vanderplanki TaxID=319348 RepID=A0A9J6CM62_POLVA|nr:hypothetical protein PVAND_012347 [Polypedilum vanderplanki]
MEESSKSRRVTNYYGNPSIITIEKSDIAKDVKNLHKALSGFITNKQTIINILCTKNNRQRIEISKAYKTCYDQDLILIIRKKLSGDFLKLLIALLTPTIEFLCHEIYDALNRAGTDDATLVSILCTLSNYEINEVCQKYHKFYEKTLEKDIRSDTSGNFRKILLSILNATRDETKILDLYTARIDAMELKTAGIARWGTDTSTFNRILCLRNYDQIKLISQEYEYITGNTLDKDIKKEFSGDVLDALLSIYRFAVNRPEYFARCFHRAVIGLGTDDRALIRLVVTRCEIDMNDIKEAYAQKYGKSLRNAVKNDTSGYYRKALLKLIGE